MWKNVKFKKGALSILLILGLVLSNLRSFDSFASETDSGQNDFKAQLVEVLKPVYADKSGKIATDLSEIVKEDKQKDVLALLQSALKNQAGSAEKAEKEKNEGANAPEDTKESDASKAEDGSKLQESGSVETEAKEARQEAVVAASGDVTAESEETVSVIPAPPRPESAPSSVTKASKGLSKEELEQLITFINSKADIDKIKNVLNELKKADVTTDQVNAIALKLKSELQELKPGEKYKIVSYVIKQGDKTIEATDSIDYSENISVKAKVQIRIKPANEGGVNVGPGGMVSIELGKKINYKGSNEEFKIYDSSKPNVVMANAKIRESNGSLFADITLVNDESVLGNGDSVVFDIELAFGVDKSQEPGNESLDKKVIIFDKEYKVVNSAENIKMTKEGKVDWNNTRIVWTVTIRKTSQTNNSLKGYQFSDDLKNAGPYVENSFKITDFSDNQIPGANHELKGDTLTCILPEATKDNVKISFMTSLNTDLEKGDIKNDFSDKNKYNEDILDKDGNKLYRKKYNLAKLFVKGEDGQDNLAAQADAKVSGENYWGGKYYANLITDRITEKFKGKYGILPNKDPRYNTDVNDAQYIKDGKIFDEDPNYYYVDWVVVFDATDKNLENVKIEDKLPKDMKNLAQMEFVSAKVKLWVNGQWEEKKAYDEKNQPANNTYPIDESILGKENGKTKPLNTAVKLNIRVKVLKKNVPFRTSFTNIAKVYWGNGEVKIDNLFESIELPNDQLLRKEVIGRKEVTEYNGVTNTYVTTEPVWMLGVRNKNIVNGKTYVYDPIIYDESIKHTKVDYSKFAISVGGEKKNVIHDQKIENLFYKKGLTHSVYLKGTFNPSGSSIRMHEHDLYYNDKKVGVLLEFYNFEKQNNVPDNYMQQFTIQTKVVDGGIFTYDGTNVLNSAMAQVTMEDGRTLLEPAYSWNKNRSRMVLKHALASNAAISLTDSKDRSVNKNPGINTKTYKWDGNEDAKDEDEKAYNPNNKSVLYRLSVNANGYKTHDDRATDSAGNIVTVGAIELIDSIDKGWTFDKIDNENKYLLYRGIGNTTDDGRGRFVTADGEPLSKAKVDDIIDSYTVSTDPGTGKTIAKFKFKKLDGPYVILLKAKMVDNETLFGNDKGTVRNEAKVVIRGEENRSSYKVSYDKTFLTKETIGEPVDKQLRWRITYNPSQILKDKLDFIKNANKVELVDEMGKNMEPLVYSDGRPAFNGGNYVLKETTEDGTTNEYIESDELEKFILVTKGTNDLYKLTLTIPKDKRSNTYVLEYTTLLNAGVGYKFNNTVKLIADTSTEIGKVDKLYNFLKASGIGNTTPGMTTVYINKVDEKGGKLKGAKFTLVEKGTTDKIESKVGKDDIIYFDNVKAGKKYILKETQAPKDYQIDNGEYEFEVEALNNGHAYSIKGLTVVKGKVELGDQATTIRFHNRPDKVDFTFYKADVKDFDGIKSLKDAEANKLSGAKFTLKKEGETNSITLKEDKGKFTATGLDSGNYTLTEISAPAGYEVVQSSYTIKVDVKVENGKQIKLMKGNAEVSSIDKAIKMVDGVAVVFNKKALQKTLDIKLVKADIVDANANSLNEVTDRLDGAEFTLTNDADNAVITSAAVEGKGNLIFKAVKAGTYTLKETRQPAGYEPLTKTYKVTVTEDTGNGMTFSVAADNDKHIKMLDGEIVVFNEKVYDLNLLKADLDVNTEVVIKGSVTLGAIKTPLNGAKFRLALASNTAVFYSAVTGDKDKVASDGSIVFKGLKSGIYVLTEEAAPSGYNPLKDSYTIVVTASAVTTEFKIKDPRAGEIRELDGTVVVFNKKTPYIPGPSPIPDPDPTPGPGPSPSPDPSPNPNPNPNPPTPTTDLPRYPENNFPDPNDPNSPDEFVAVDEDGTPQGKYIKSKKPDGTEEYIPVDEDKIPQGVKPAKKLPRTGEANTTVYYLGGAMLLLLAGAVVVRRKKYNK